MTGKNAAAIYQDLSERGIKVWIDGGWGVDALLGDETRAHADLDIVIQTQDLDKLMSFFEENAYQDVPKDDTSNWNFVMGSSEGEIDVHVMTLDAEGNGTYGPVEQGISYPAYAFGGVGSIDGLKVRCISAEYHLISHTGYTLRDKDFHDVGRLCERFGLEPPDDYKDDL